MPRTPRRSARATPTSALTSPAVPTAAIGHARRRSAPDPPSGVPAVGLSIKPSTPATSNRLRHLATVVTVTPRSAATRAGTAADSANANTILARIARRDDPPCGESDKSVALLIGQLELARSRHRRKHTSIIETYVTDLRRDTLGARTCWKLVPAVGVDRQAAEVSGLLGRPLCLLREYVQRIADSKRRGSAGRDDGRCQQVRLICLPSTVPG